MSPAHVGTIAGPLDVAALAQQVEALFGRFRPSAVAERRCHERLALPIPVRLTPLDHAGRPLAEQAITVVGRDISPRGLSFFHEETLTYRRAIIEVDHPELGQFSAEVDIRWCRFARRGWYESGGRLLGVVSRDGTRSPERFSESVA
ncbi:MAG: hypothetical protein L0Z07_00575 [Planctomycetes bacterium]|nr:hypothetical protein [Planctomycetota bacterium]